MAGFSSDKVIAAAIAAALVVILTPIINRTLAGVGLSQAA